MGTLNLPCTNILLHPWEGALKELKRQGFWPECSGVRAARKGLGCGTERGRHQGSDGTGSGSKTITWILDLGAQISNFKCIPKFCHTFLTWAKNSEFMDLLRRVGVDLRTGCLSSTCGGIKTRDFGRGIINKIESRVRQSVCQLMFVCHISVSFVSATNYHDPSYTCGSHDMIAATVAL